MNCPKCQHENKIEAKFCSNCGAKLQKICPQCGAKVEQNDHFCSECGTALETTAKDEEPGPDTTKEPLSYTPHHLAEKILQNRDTLEGERRTVTVLFADTAGSTNIGEQLDEEEVYTITQECMDRMMDAVHRYEGTVSHFLGDGMMAIFGAPIAHEDSARRAVCAALEMQKSLKEYAGEVKQRHPIECQFRIGLNTGPVVVGKIGDNLDMDYSAVGDTVNLGARMEQVAEPGTVYISENTYQAVKDYFECESLGAMKVKGKAEPVTAYKALREKLIRTRFEASTAHGLTPFVGRQHELTVLREHVNRVKNGQGQVVFVSGEAGIGKSRLLLEFQRSIMDENVAWLEGHCISFGQNISYLPIIDIIKHAFGVEEGDNEARIIQRMDEETVKWDDAARKTVPYLKYLLNVDPDDPTVSIMDPRERRAGIFDGLRALVTQESARRPMVVVVEDLQWIDEQSEATLAVLADIVVSAPVLLILSYRPGYTHSLGDRTYYNHLVLSNLPQDDSTAMLQSVLQVVTLPQELQSLITIKAEGNPFYIEEVTKSLLEAGVLRKTDSTYVLECPIEEIRVPNTIQEVILSRIDRLEHQARETIQLASVIGREFTVRLLKRISEVRTKLDGLLEELKLLELIYQKTYFPELSYMFKHALTQDVAYSTLLLERRKALHRIIGAAIEELYNDRLPEHYEILAYHYYEGEDWEKALDYLEKAGDKATAAYANQDARDYYARALEICEKLGDSAIAAGISLNLKRGFASCAIADYTEAIADFNRMLSIARHLGDRRLEGLSLVYREYAEFWSHRFFEVEKTLHEALIIGEEEGIDDVRFAANCKLAIVLPCIGRYEEGQQYWRVAEELAPKVDVPFWQAAWGMFGAIILYYQGRYDDVLDHLNQWREVGEALHNSDLLLWGLNAKGIALGGKGEYEKALTIFEEMLITSERIGAVYYPPMVLNTIGWVYSEFQDHHQAIDWNTRSAEMAKKFPFGYPEMYSFANVNLGNNLMALGRLDEAEKYFLEVEQAVYNARVPEDLLALFRYAQNLFHSFGELCLIKGDYDMAMSYADKSLELAESNNNPKNIVKARRLRGQIFTVQDSPMEAEQELAISLKVARKVGNPPQLWQTYAALGDLRKAQNRSNDALEAYHNAISIIHSVAEGLTESHRKTFLNSGHVKEIQKKAD